MSVLQLAVRQQMNAHFIARAAYPWADVYKQQRPGGPAIVICHHAPTLHNIQLKVSVDGAGEAHAAFNIGAYLYLLKKGMPFQNCIVACGTSLDRILPASVCRSPGMRLACFVLENIHSPLFTAEHLAALPDQFRLQGDKEQMELYEGFLYCIPHRLSVIEWLKGQEQLAGLTVVPLPPAIPDDVRVSMRATTDRLLSALDFGSLSEFQRNYLLQELHN